MNSCSQLLSSRAARGYCWGVNAARASIHRDVLRDLLARIIDGEFSAGTPLPAEAKLAEQYGVSRGTIRTALSGLEDRGMLVPVQGAGWIVQSSLNTQSFRELRSFAQWARSKGMTPGGQVHSATPRPASVQEARKLLVKPKSEVLEVTRTRTLDGRVVMLERTIYPEWMSEKIRSLPADEPSVVTVLAERFGVVTAHADHAIDAVAASSTDAALLHVRRSSPLLRVRRTSFTGSGVPIEHGEDRYLPDTITFHAQTSNASNTLSRAD